MPNLPNNVNPTVFIKWISIQPFYESVTLSNGIEFWSEYNDQTAYDNFVTAIDTNYDAVSLLVDPVNATVTVDNPTEVYDVYWYSGVYYDLQEAPQPTLDNVDPILEIQDEQGNPIIGKHLVLIIGQSTGQMGYAEFEVTNA